jgi:hypothetical protein
MSIEIEQTQIVDNKPITEPVSQDQPVEPDNIENKQTDINPDLEHELQVKLQPILLDSAINALGNTLQKLTSLEDMNFTEDEHKALVDAWTPLLPSVSPMTNAVLVTVIIMSGKGLLYVAYKRKSKSTDNKSLPEESKGIKEAVS